MFKSILTSRQLISHCVKDFNRHKVIHNSFTLFEPIKLLNVNLHKCISRQMTTITFDKDSFKSRDSSLFPIRMDQNMNLFLSSKNDPLDVVLDNGKIAQAYTKDSFSYKELEDLKTALNFVLEQPIQFEEKNPCVAHTRLFDGITAEVRDGGIECPTSLKVFRNNIKLILKFDGGWLKNWTLNK